MSACVRASERDGQLLSATGSSWADSPVTQIQSRPSAPTRRKSLVFIQRGSEKETETKVEGSFHERQSKKRKTLGLLSMLETTSDPVL